jgi:prenyltransferase beta subunit
MRSLFVMLAVLISGGLGQQAARAGEIPAAYRPTIEKGLAWLVKQQNRDGSWPNASQQSDVTCTAVAGLALLMEGSTAARGKYAENVEKAVGWMLQNCQDGKDDGLLGQNARQDRSGYMAGQGYGVLFLASAYAREEKSDATGLDARLARVRQREMEGVLKRAVQFIVKAQARNGGWGFVSSQDGQEMDDAGSTLSQILALRAAQQADIAVPKETMQKAYAYLEKMTTPRGGITFSSRRAGQSGGERPGLTIAAFAVTAGAAEVRPELLKKWLRYSQNTITLSGATADLFHFAVAVHALGDEGYAKLIGGRDGEMLVWSKVRDKFLNRFQAPAGTVYREWNPSPVFGTAINLMALQLDNNHLPILRTKKNW